MAPRTALLFSPSKALLFKTCDYQGEAGGGKMVWKIGVSGFKALYVGYIYIYILLNHLAV